jgi:hypothetical protein
MNLYGVTQSMTLYSNDHDGWFPVPHRIAGDDRRELDTSAGLYAAMIMHLGLDPRQLVSGNERSIRVEIDRDYDFDAYDPGAGVYWDPRFVADLAVASNTSFAHLPLFGLRHARGWRAHSTSERTPLVGSRGPKDGVPDPSSLTCDDDGRWAGHIAFGDGHVAFTTSFTPTRLGDNVLFWEDGAAGADVILAFTRRMDAEDGPTLQFD